MRRAREINPNPFGVATEEAEEEEYIDAFVDIRSRSSARSRRFPKGQKAYPESYRQSIQDLATARIPKQAQSDRHHFLRFYRSSSRLEGGSSQRVPPGEQPPPLGGLQGSSLPQKELKGALRQLLSSDTSGSVEGSHKDGSRTPTVRVPSAEMYPPEGGLSRRDPSNWRSDIAAPVGSVGPGRGGHKQPPAGEGESRAREVEAVVRPSGTSGGPGSRRSQSARQVAEEADDSIPSPHRANQGYSQGPISDALGWKSEALAEETELVEWQRARGSWADGRMQGGGEKGMAEDEGWRKRPSQHAKSPPDLGHLDQSSAELEEHSPQPSQGVEASSRLAGRQGGRGGSGAHGVGSSPGCQNLNDGTQSGGQSRIPSAPVCVPSSSPARPQGSPQRMPRFPTHSAVHLRTVEWQSPLRGRGTRRSGVDGAGSVQEWPVEIAMGSGGSVGSRRVAHGQDGEGYKGREGYRREGCGEVTEAEGADVEGGEKEKQAVGVVDAEGWAGGAEGEERQGAEAEEKADGLRGSSMQELGKRKPSGITARGTMAEASHLRRSSLGRHGSGGREGHAGTAAAGGSSTDRRAGKVVHASKYRFTTHSMLRQSAGGGPGGPGESWQCHAALQPHSRSASPHRRPTSPPPTAKISMSAALVAKAEELRNTDQTLVAASLIADPTLPTVIHDDTTTSLREPDPTGPIQWSPRHVTVVTPSPTLDASFSRHESPPTPASRSSPHPQRTRHAPSPVPFFLRPQISAGVTSADTTGASWDPTWGELSDHLDEPPPMIGMPSHHAGVSEAPFPAKHPRMDPPPLVRLVTPSSIATRAGPLQRMPGGGSEGRTARPASSLPRGAAAKGDGASGRKRRGPRSARQKQRSPPSLQPSHQPHLVRLRTPESSPEAHSQHPAHPALVHLLHTPRVPSTVEEAAVRVASPADLAGCASEPHFGLSAPPPHGACDDTLRPSTSEPQICLNQSKLRDPEERPEKQASHHDGAEERRRHRALSEDCSEAADDTWQEVMTDDALNDSEDGSPRLRVHPRVPRDQHIPPGSFFTVKGPPNSVRGGSARGADSRRASMPMLKGLSARDHPKGGAGRGGDPWHCLKHVVMYPLRKARQERRANRTKWGVQVLRCTTFASCVALNG
ncbi:hypothetical protein CYMTET_42172 [Cymbomonas tetramitiformis]|uniref:Uncharacterized protein n=1 Tax=Cymbomonas tetramitiformis TaxID=36881 RepID=A0AAE0C5Z2_9CHLO|nr:hypothetical protein CYMTET_42172 [Cymbomonas tetramitiformis]